MIVLDQAASDLGQAIEYLENAAICLEANAIYEKVAERLRVIAEAVEDNLNDLVG